MFLIGYFNTLDKIKYGVDSKKRPYLAFIPFNSNYKKIKITYSGKQKGKLLAQIEIINFDDFPTGRIVNIIGNYHKDNILDLILKDSQHKYIEENIIEKEIVLENYEKEFITIDPIGSEDLDDGFSLNYPVLDIIIACPVYFLDENKILNKFKDAVSSRYYNKTDHLWGNKINSKASLLKNNKTVLEILSYNLETKEFDVNFKLGENKHQLSYDFVDEILNKKNNEEYKFLIEWYNILKKYFIFNNSHELIEKIMILGNQKLIEYLEKNNLPVIYREFICNHFYDDLNIDKNIIQIFNNRKSESAIYSLNKKNHELIGSIYTHFTSPLRRLIDTIHQLIIFKYKIDREKLELLEVFENLSEINKKFKLINKFHREYNLLKNNKELDLNLEYEGILFNIKNNVLDVWCDQLKRFIVVEFTNIKLLFQYEIINENKFWKIINKLENKEYIYKLGQTIKFKLLKTCNILPSKEIIGLIINNKN